MLIDNVKKAQNGSQDDMLFLVQKFTPLLRNLSHKLHIEDGFEEMTLAFLELVYKINPETMASVSDGAVVNYISVSMRNAYIAKIREIIQKKNIEDSWEELTDKQKYQAISVCYHHASNYELVDFLNGFSNLSEREKTILFLIYQYGYSSAYIAELFGTSRQNINQIKNRALKKIKAQLK